MMNNGSFGKTAWLVVCLMVFLLSCNSNEVRKVPTDSPDKGTIHISVDESFKPVIDSEIQIYESAHPGTRIIAHYKPEADCLRDFAVDSIRIVIATRGYSKEEEKFIFDSTKLRPAKMVIAYDAIAVIVHPSSKDSLFTMQEIKELLTGTSEKNLVPVFDGLKATSTVRFIIDSVLRGDKLSPKVVAADSSEGVIDYVSKTANAVGFIGVSWIGNKQDSSQITYLNQVKVAAIEHPSIPGKFVTPAQYNIYYRRYPMVRDLVYVVKENHKGLGKGFVNFLTTQRGQLIFNRAFLMPALMDFEVREASVSEE